MKAVTRLISILAGTALVVLLASCTAPPQQQNCLYATPAAEHPSPEYYARTPRTKGEARQLNDEVWRHVSTLHNVFEDAVTTRLRVTSRATAKTQFEEWALQQHLRCLTNCLEEYRSLLRDLDRRWVESMQNKGNRH